MSLYKPSELKAFLDSNNKRASKRLSQNFLIDKNILDKIVGLNKLYLSFPTLEIGPGPGALTEHLLSCGFKVTAIELDSAFATLLTQRLGPFYPHLKVIENDFLKLNLSDLLNEAPLWNVIANLPYHISSKALVKLLTYGKSLISLTLMVQKEFYERILVLSGKDYGPLNILVKICTSKIEHFNVSPGCFYPPPRVDSCVMHLTLECPHSVKFLESFYGFLKEAFKNRRKKIISNLSSFAPTETLKKVFLTLNLSEDSRVESLNPAAYLALFQTLSRSASPIKGEPK